MPRTTSRAGAPVEVVQLQAGGLGPARARATADRTEYQRVTLVREDDELVAHPTGSQSSSRLMSLARAHALVRVPPGEGGLAPGELVEALILALPD